MLCCHEICAYSQTNLLTFNNTQVFIRCCLHEISLQPMKLHWGLCWWMALWGQTQFYRIYLPDSHWIHAVWWKGHRKIPCFLLKCEWSIKHPAQPLSCWMGHFPVWATAFLADRKGAKRYPSVCQPPKWGYTSSGFCQHPWKMNTLNQTAEHALLNLG